MIILKRNTTKQRLEINNYQVVFDVVNILELVNSIDSRVARIERQIKEMKRNGGNNNG